MTKTLHSYRIGSWQHLLHCCCGIALFSASFAAQAQERWFQIEVSVFSNEALADRAEEQWQARANDLAFPSRMQRLQSLLDILLIDALLPAAEQDQQADDNGEELASFLAAQAEQRAADLRAVGPPPLSLEGGFKFFDFSRDSFLQLPSGLSDFQQTNRTLDRSPEHRLLFHGLWRQPVLNSNQAVPLFVRGGENFGDYDELQGSLTIRFNDNRDRVVIDADLWLTQFSTLPLENATWQLPVPPDAFTSASLNPADDTQQYHPIAVYHMDQSRDMRSDEFHYLDHPALGIVIMVEPYELPVQAPQGFDVEVAEEPTPTQ